MSSLTVHKALSNAAMSLIGAAPKFPQLPDVLESVVQRYTVVHLQAPPSSPLPAPVLGHLNRGCDDFPTAVSSCTFDPFVHVYSPYCFFCLGMLHDPVREAFDALVVTAVSGHIVRSLAVVYPYLQLLEGTAGEPHAPHLPALYP